MSPRLIAPSLFALTAGALAHAGSLSSWNADALMAWNFESMSPGSAPSSREIWTDPTPGNTVMVTDADTKPADPLAKGHNHSLYVTHPAEAKKPAQIQFALPAGMSPLASGTVSFDLFVVGTRETPGLIEIDLGMLGSESGPQRANSVAAIQVWTNSMPTNTSTHNAPGYFLAFSEGTSGSNNLYAFNEQVPVDKQSTISVTWDAPKSSYEVMINGHPCTRGQGASAISRFSTTQPVTGVNAIRFKSANNASTSFFVDNVTFQAGPDSESK